MAIIWKKAVRLRFMVINLAGLNIFWYNINNCFIADYARIISEVKNACVVTLPLSLRAMASEATSCVVASPDRNRDEAIPLV